MLKNAAYNSNYDFPKMLSKTGLRNMISGRRKQITSAT
jgi:hypothetical protein